MASNYLEIVSVLAGRSSDAPVPSVLRQKRALASHTGKSGKQGTYWAFFISRTLLPNMRSQKIAVIA